MFYVHGSIIIRTNEIGLLKPAMLSNTVPSTLNVLTYASAPLVSQHATVSVRVEQRQQRAAELAEQVQARESEMAVRCEPERSGLEALREEQRQLQVRGPRLSHSHAAAMCVTSPGFDPVTSPESSVPPRRFKSMTVGLVVKKLPKSF